MVVGVILENYLCGWKKVLWFSVFNDFKYDVECDLWDIEVMGIVVYVFSKIKYGDIIILEGVFFVIYFVLIGESQVGGQYCICFWQILDWCGEVFEGVIVFDECYKVKNVGFIKMGKVVLDLQNKLFLVCVVYVSVIGVFEFWNMIYMSCLGIWGEGIFFWNFEEFLYVIEKRGVGVMEIVVMDMKVSGMYIVCQFSFFGVIFCIEEILLVLVFECVYNCVVLLWVEVLNVFQQVVDWIGLELCKFLWGQFWLVYQCFFKYLCIVVKVCWLVELV